MTEEKIGVVGLGYVGLALAVALSENFAPVRCWETSGDRIEDVRRGLDTNLQLSKDQLLGAKLEISQSETILSGCSLLIVCVSTPIDKSNQPDLTELRVACEGVGRILSPGCVVVIESTVYPGATEQFCGDILATISGLRRGIDFFVGYSPERLNPGPAGPPLSSIVKVIAGEDKTTVERIASVYSAIIPAGLHIAPSIRTAEASKLIENVQRDVNIALLNEFSMLCRTLHIETQEVLAAARTKWNFLDFHPGLVGGHCISVDPHYLLSAANVAGISLPIVSTSRATNESMAQFVARFTTKSILSGNVDHVRVGIFGLAYKENVCDMRNSGALRLLEEFRLMSITPLAFDPLINSRAWRHSGIDLRLSTRVEMRDLDVAIVTVGHRAFLRDHAKVVTNAVKHNGAIFDLCGYLLSHELREDIRYFSL